MCFDDVVFRYGNAKENALNGITVNIRRGEFTVVIGPNGSGKSTFARHIKGLLRPLEGRVAVEGISTTNPDQLPEIMRRVGFVFQNPDNQLVGATVEEDIAFGPENLGVDPPSIRDSVNRAMAEVGLLELAGRPPHNLSGGQKQLLAIAGALAMKNKCLVLDEPTSMLGPAGKRLVMNLLLKLRAGFNITLIMVTHFMEEAVFADRILVMDKGKIVMDGTPREVFREGRLLSIAGLELPGPVELSNRLRSYGVALPDPVLTLDELVTCLCRICPL
ncbi:MAG: energy-coupling factor transporter ATPase [Desulfocucumaceae bacterium]